MSCVLLLVIIIENNGKEQLQIDFIDGDDENNTWDD
jgi:hypothetical protein